MCGENVIFYLAISRANYLYRVISLLVSTLTEALLFGDLNLTHWTGTSKMSGPRVWEVDPWPQSTAWVSWFLLAFPGLGKEMAEKDGCQKRGFSEF